MTDPITQSMIQGAAGAAGGATYVDDVFKSYVYRGTGGATQTITTGLDIAGDGGLVWVKNRSNAANHTLQDSLLGDNKYIVTSSANGSGTNTTRIKTITSTGFQVGDDGDTGGNNVDYVSWNFKKTEGFFDLVEYTGNGAASQTLSHELGSVPGCMMLKPISTNGDWRVWHRGITPNTATYGLTLNGNGATYGTMGDFGSTNPTATQFTVGSAQNTDGVTYRCYLFAHDQAVFGEDEDQSIIKCGSISCPSQGNGVSVDLGWEPQFLLLKRTDGTEDWWMMDTMRRYPACDTNIGPQNMVLRANTASQEQPETYDAFNSTGFSLWNLSSRNFIYIAIRMPDGYVGKPPALGTDVFTAAVGESGSSVPAFPSGFITDFAIRTTPGSTQNRITATRLLSHTYLYTNSTDAEVSGDSDASLDYNTGFGDWTSDLSNWQAWMWKRGQGFDVVAYKGNGTAGRQIQHSLGRAAEMVWVRRRQGDNWQVGHKGLNGGTNAWSYVISLNTNGAESNAGADRFNNTAPTATHLTLGTDGGVNSSSYDYICMLFASVDGISKVGSYAGSDSAQTITTGFQPRFVLIKVINHQDGWTVLDTTRGWGSGNDQFLQLDVNSAQAAADAGAPTSTGFTLTVADVWNNANRNYIYYAHA